MEYLAGLMEHVAAPMESLTGLMDYLNGLMEHPAGRMEHLRREVLHSARVMDHLAGHLRSQVQHQSAAGLLWAYDLLLNQLEHPRVEPPRTFPDLLV